MSKSSYELAAEAWYGGPQKLGILPTWSIWADREMRRMFEPVAVFFAFPLLGLLYVLHLTVALPWEWIAILLLLYPYLLMGLVERYIRRRKWKPGQTERSPGLQVVSMPPDRRILRTMIGACLALALAAAFEAPELVLLAILGLGVAAVMTVSWRMMMPPRPLPLSKPGCEG